MGKGVEKLYKYIENEGIDTVICPHVFSAMMVTELIEKYPVELKTAFVGTDYTCSPGTAESRLGFYFMAGSEENMPLPEDRIIRCTIPVRQKFYSFTDKAEAKRLLQIPDGKKHLLVMCGSMGCGPMKRICHELKKAIGEDAVITVICGTNKKLRFWLNLAHSKQENIRILGYTENMPLIMDSSDLYLTKPGGISTSEAAVKALPLVLIDAVAGCEKHNLEYMIQSGLALTAKDPNALALLCAELLKDDARLEKMSSSAAKVKNENPSQVIFDTLSKK